jgi:adenylyl- and sulfurtransferase ThiI
VALGTALTIPNSEIKTAAKQVFGVKEALEVVKKTSAKENRVKEVISEIAALLS